MPTRAGRAWRFYTVPGEPGKPDWRPIRSGAREQGQAQHGMASFWKNGRRRKRSGIRWPTIPSSTCCTSEPTTAHPGTAQSVPPVAVINLFIASISRVTPGHGRVRVALPGDPPERVWDFSAAQHNHARGSADQRSSLRQDPDAGHPRTVFFYVLDRGNRCIHRGTALSPRSNWAQEPRPPLGAGQARIHRPRYG